MALSILTALERIKADPAHWLAPAAIDKVCHALGYSWRQRLLDPATTIHLFILQILHGNTACSHVPRLGGIDCSGEAYAQARQRLPLALFGCLLLLVRDRLPKPSTAGLWRGQRTFLADGSSASMPDTPELQDAYGQPGVQKPGCGFPVMHLLALFDAATGLLLELVSAPLRTHDMARVQEVHPALAAGDILVGDRAFCSYAHLAVLQAREVLAVFRIHQRRHVDFRAKCPAPKKSAKISSKTNTKKRAMRAQRRASSYRLQRLGRHDQLMLYRKPAQRPEWLSAEAYAALPEELEVRELRYKLRIPGCRTRTVTLATTLLDPVRYPAQAVAELYGERWQIETNLRHLKQTLGMDVLRCQSVEGVQKELAMYALVYNLVRCVMLEAAQRQEVPVQRLSFVDAARWLAQACAGQAPPLRLRLNPWRPHRYEPRAVKRRPKAYDRLNQPRDALRKKLLKQKDAA